MRAMAAQSRNDHSSMQSRASHQDNGDFDNYTPGQWAAPSPETLAREFKEVVKTAHRIRINDALTGGDRKGKELSEEAALAIARCEARRNYLLEQIREHELRRVQKARIRQRERVLSKKAIQREKMMRERMSVQSMPMMGDLDLLRRRRKRRRSMYGNVLPHLLLC